MIEITAEMLDTIIELAAHGECPAAFDEFEPDSPMWAWCDFQTHSGPDGTWETCSCERPPLGFQIAKRACWIHYAQVRLAEEDAARNILAGPDVPPPHYSQEYPDFEDEPDPWEDEQ